MTDVRIEYLPSANGQHAYCVSPERAEAVVLVIHEVWGLTPHIKSVCKRLGSLRIATIAPNLYSSRTGLFSPRTIRQAMSLLWDLSLNERYDTDKVIPLLMRKRASARVVELTRVLYSRTFRKEMLAQLVGWADYARSRHGRVSAIGFSMGGRMALELAAAYPPLKSCASVCGQPPTARDLAKIMVPMLVIYAGRDDFMNSEVPGFIREVLQRRKEIHMRIFGNAKHEFYNTGNKAGYRPRDAADSWNAITGFLSSTLQLSYPLNRLERWK